MTNNYSLPSKNLNSQPRMSMTANLADSHHGFGAQQYWHQFYGNNGHQQQFSNCPPMQSMSHIPDLMQMTVGLQNMNSNSKRQVNNIWSQQYQQLNKEGNGREHMQGRPFQFHQNQSKWNRYGCPNGNIGNKRNNQNQQKPSHKKEKVDKRDLAENNVFYCDACDRGFKTEQVYTEHVKNHQKCSFKDCSYVAAPKLVELHCKLQHRNGYAKKIWSMESKEDVETWIKARKSNYPTSVNITKKETLNNEKKQRGEVLETKQFGKMKGRGRFDKKDRNGNWKRKNLDSHNFQDDKKIKIDNEKIDSLRDQKEIEAIKVADPLSILMHSTTPSITNDFNAEGNSETSETQSVGLTSILTCYGSDTDDSDDEEVTTGPSNVKLKEDIATTINSNCIDNIESCSTAVSKADGMENKEQNKESGNAKRKRNKNKKKAAYHNEPQKKKPSLLEMLLAKEIRHERNIILQCVHYIVKKNFLQEENS